MAKVQLSLPVPRIPVRTMAIVGVALVGLALIAFTGWTVNANIVALRAPRALPAPTIVCGPFAEPLAVMGIPRQVSGNAVIFEDGFVLPLQKPIGFYKDRLGLFSMAEGKMGYATVKDAGFNPCPASPSTPQPRVPG